MAVTAERTRLLLLKVPFDVGFPTGENFVEKGRYFANLVS